MRTTALLFASFSLASLVPADSDACGMPDPVVFQVSSHYTRGGTRSFVLTGAQATGKPVWRMLAPGTYDGTRIADAPAPPFAVELTLLGPSGNRIVTSRSAVFLEHSWVHRQPSSALEVDAKRGEFTIALKGRHEGASWLQASQIYPSNDDRDWVTAQGVKSSYVSVSDLGGTDLQLVSATSDAGTVTLVRQAGHAIARFDGQALGAIKEYGMTYIVATDRDHVTAIAI